MLQKSKIFSRRTARISSLAAIAGLIVSQAPFEPARAGHLGHTLLNAVTSVARQEVPTNLVPDKLETGSTADANATRLTSELHWYRSLSEAEADASREHKLVFWLHMLGNIEGKT